MIDSLIVKFATPCNIACTYCYEYANGDTTWKTKPKHISADVASHISNRIKEYCLSHKISTINLVAHGGEPLLLGAKKLDDIFGLIREISAPIEINFSLQTNGLLLDEEICAVLATHKVLVGISLDGNINHNSKRVDHQGHETYTRTIRGIKILQSNELCRFAGILSVVNIENDPIEVIDSICALRPPVIDFLQPFLTHDSVGVNRVEIAKKFGEWMARAMHHWISNPQYAKIKIRVFEDALKSTISRKPTSDWFGPRKLSYIVIETDGNYDVLDQLKSAGANSKTLRYIDRNVFNCSLTEANKLAEQHLSRFFGANLPTDCLGCEWSDVCAGGHLPARYSSAKGFNNKSVYCEGIKMLLTDADKTIREYVSREVDNKQVI